MHFTLTVKMDNAAFGEDEYEAADELGRILSELGGRLQSDTSVQDGSTGRLMDYNGNTVGSWEVSA
jgi:hypothetical protein